MPPNILQLQREVESLSDERLIQEAQMPNMFPPYLTQQEMLRRETRRKAQQVREAQQPTNTVHDRLIERAMSGIGSLPQQLSPEQEMFAQQAIMEMSPEQMMQQQMMMQQPQPMADGGLVGYQDGGYYDPMGAEEFFQMQYGVPSVMGRRQPVADYGLGDVLDDVGLNVDPWSFLSQDSRSAVERPIGPVGENHSGIPTPSVARGEGPEGIASLIASMQAPVFGREAMDVSEYYEMTPEERKLLEFYGSGAQSLESRIDTESDRLSAQANILSNVARAMARGQVPTISQPLRELQTEQRGRREGIMDESRAMEMAALAQEAGLSRAEQEALMERAIIGEERDYQEAQRQRLVEERLRFAEMLNSEDPEERMVGAAMLGIAPRSATETAVLQERSALLSSIAEMIGGQITAVDEEGVTDLRDQIVNLYLEQAAAVGLDRDRLKSIVEDFIKTNKPEYKTLLEVEAQIAGAANGGLFKDTYQIEF